MQECVQAQGLDDIGESKAGKDKACRTHYRIRCVNITTLFGEISVDFDFFSSSFDFLASIWAASFALYNSFCSFCLAISSVVFNILRTPSPIKNVPIGLSGVIHNNAPQATSIPPVINAESVFLLLGHLFLIYVCDKGRAVAGLFLYSCILDYKNHLRWHLKFSMFLLLLFDHNSIHSIYH